jgi:hypothetical protein
MDELEGVKLLPTIIRVHTGAGFVTVYQSAGFINGWIGSVIPTGLGYNFVMVHPTPFPILGLVQVRVETYDQAPVPNKLDITYSFTAENLELDSPIIAGNNGYGPVDMMGNIPAGVYQVYVGPNGNSTDPQAYNGTPGSGGTDVEFVDVSLSKTAPARGVYFPPLPIGGPYTITLVGSSTLTLAASVTVVAHASPSKMLGLRGTLPRQYATGPRSIVQTRYPQE